MFYKIPNSYKVLKNEKIFSYSSLVLRSILQEDIEPIRNWRNNQTTILRQKSTISKEIQQEYYENNVWNEMRSKHPKLILFSILKNSKIVGYGGFVNISWEDKRAEMSFLLSDKISKQEALYVEIFEQFIYLAKHIAFTIVDFNRIFTETYDLRPLHISILEKNGFQFEGRMKSHLIIDNEEVDSLIHGCLKSEYEK